MRNKYINSLSLSNFSIPIQDNKKPKADSSSNVKFGNVSIIKNYCVMLFKINQQFPSLFSAQFIHP